MVKNKPNRPLSRLINHFNKDAPPSDTQHLTISHLGFGRESGRKCNSGLAYVLVLMIVGPLFLRMVIVQHQGFAEVLGPSRADTEWLCGTLLDWTVNVWLIPEWRDIFCLKVVYFFSFNCSFALSTRALRALILIQGR